MRQSTMRPNLTTRLMLGLGLTLTLSAGSCVTGGSLEVLCDRTVALEADHASSLAATPDDAAVMTGQRYIAAVAAGCGRV